MKALTLAVLLAAAACAPAIQSNGLQSIVTERLYFGRNVAQTLGVTDSAWAMFVADVVSAQLPSGFTFWAATGEWRGGGGRAARRGAGEQTPEIPSPSFLRFRALLCKKKKKKTRRRPAVEP